MPLAVYKPPGLTPLETVKHLRSRMNIPHDTPVSYAGRLDPLAEGVLLILIGAENTRRKMYEKLPKEYEFEILFGASTDTFDVLGKLISTASCQIRDLLPLPSILSGYRGTFIQQYPPFSSAKVLGHPLYYWARMGKIDTIAIPEKQVHVTRIEPGKAVPIAFESLYSQIVNRIHAVQGEFRQGEILNLWESYYRKHAQTQMIVLPVSIATSNGVYIRSLCNDIGLRLKIPALAWRIKRTRVGQFGLSDCIKIFSTPTEASPGESPNT